MTDHKDILDAPDESVSVGVYLRRSFIANLIGAVILAILLVVAFFSARQFGLIGAIGIYPMLGVVLVLGLFTGFYFGVITLVKVDIVLPKGRVWFQMVAAYLLYITVLYFLLFGIDSLLGNFAINRDFFIVFGKYLLGTAFIHALASFLLIKRVVSQLDE